MLHGQARLHRQGQLLETLGQKAAPQCPAAAASCLEHRSDLRREVAEGEALVSASERDDWSRLNDG